MPAHKNDSRTGTSKIHTCTIRIAEPWLPWLPQSLVSPGTHGPRASFILSVWSAYLSLFLCVCVRALEHWIDISHRFISADTGLWRGGGGTGGSCDPQDHSPWLANQEQNIAKPLMSLMHSGREECCHKKKQLNLWSWNATTYWWLIQYGWSQIGSTICKGNHPHN